MTLQEIFLNAIFVIFFLKKNTQIFSYWFILIISWSFIFNDNELSPLQTKQFIILKYSHSLQSM